MGKIWQYFIFICFYSVYIFVLRKWTYIYIFNISAHLDPALVSFGEKVNIRLLNQKIIFFDIVSFA